MADTCCRSPRLCKPRAGSPSSPVELRELQSLGLQSLGVRQADRANSLLSLRRPPALYARGESRKVEGRRRETRLARTVFDEAVRYADMEQRQLHVMGGEQLADARAGAADDGVLFDRDDGPVTCGERHDQLLIERLDEAHVDERSVQALGDLAG